MMRALLLTVAALLSAALAAGPAAAQISVPAQSSSVISAAAGASGRIAVNVSAGNGSAQANIAAFSAGDLHAAAGIDNSQRAALLSAVPQGADYSEIGANAFRGVNGAIAVNQSSGNANVQANLAAVAAGKVAEVSIEQLGHVTASAQTADRLPGDGANRHRQSAVIADSAFAGSRGLIQVNQLAGSGNSTVNAFALSVNVGTQ